MGLPSTHSSQKTIRVVLKQASTDSDFSSSKSHSHEHSAFSKVDETVDSDDISSRHASVHELYEKPEPSTRHCSVTSHSGDDIEAQQPPLDLARTQTHRSGHDIVHTEDDAPNTQGRDGFYEKGDEIYNRFSKWRKIVIVALLSYCSFLAPMSSTAILAASPEVVATYNTTGAIFNVSNALYMLFMGINPLVYGPLGQIYGRKWPLVFSAVTFTAFSAGTALAPNLAAYFVFRILTAFQGTSFLIIGSACISDIYRPVERATAISAFMSGTLIVRSFFLHESWRLL